MIRVCVNVGVWGIRSLLFKKINLPSANFDDRNIGIFDDRNEIMLHM